MPGVGEGGPSQKPAEGDTIAAISTPLGEGGIGIVRVSGPKARAIAGRLFTRGPRREPPARGRAATEGVRPAAGEGSPRLLYGHAWTPDGRLLDEVLLAVMGQPHSYTREDVIEFQCHGGPVVTRAVLQAVLRAGARLAEPGEFTKRAFLNGRLDLAEAEAVMALVRSRTEASRRAAVEALGGRLSGQVRRLQERLTRAIAQVEAGVDFPDEEIDASPYGSLRGECQAIDEDLARLVGSAHAGKILRQGLKVVIAGRPNVGKSSLLNALLREDRAIVTAVPGTTRDAIEEPLDLSGVPVRLVDTAGLRATTDPVESLGVERTRQWLTAADVILAVVDVSEPLRDEDRRLLESLGAVPAIVVLNKSDLLSVDGGLSPELEREVAGLALGRERVLVSAATGAGLDRLEQALIAFVYAGSAEAPEEALVGSVRNEESLRRARSAVGEAVTTLARGLAEDLAVVDLREAWSALGEITGETVDEGILDRLFAEFCVGK